MRRVRGEGGLDLEGLGARLKSAREKHGLMPTALDELAEIGRGSVHRIEHGQRPEISGMVLHKLARTLRVSVDWLLSGEDPRPELSLVSLVLCVDRLPGLLDYVASAEGTTRPAAFYARAMHVFKHTPPELDDKGRPAVGWSEYFAAVDRGAYDEPDDPNAADGKGKGKGMAEGKGAPEGKTKPDGRGKASAKTRANGGGAMAPRSAQARGR